MSTKKIVSVEIRWEYHPADIFEEPLEVAHDGGRLTFENGTAIAKITQNLTRKARDIKDGFDQAVIAALLGAQLQKQRRDEVTVDFKNYATTAADGAKGQFIFANTVSFNITGYAPDLKITDKDGNVIRDTKRERIDATAALAKQAIKHMSDPTAAAMLMSFNTSVSDPSNALVHLYEISDALKARFGGEHQANAALGIAAQMRTLGKMANNEDLREGRHRGKFYAAGLRDATDIELQLARDSAADMIKAYLNSLG